MRCEILTIILLANCQLLNRSHEKESKLLNPEALSSAKAVERFQREATAAARLFHPNIVPVFDTGWQGEQHYIVTALIDGQTLASAIPSEGMEPVRAVSLVVQLCSGLAHAHEQGILHRDIKPGNILVDRQDRLYLMDFGLALRTEQEASRLTRVGEVMGTPAFMAPEQARGQLEQIGPATDLYTVGMVLYELLTGRVAFEGPVAAVIYHTLHSEPPRPSEIRPGLDGELEAICLRALTKDPKQRQAGAAELREELQVWLGRQPVLAVPVEWPVTETAPVARWATDSAAATAKSKGLGPPSAPVGLTTGKVGGNPETIHAEATEGMGGEAVLDALPVEESASVGAGVRAGQRSPQRRPTSGETERPLVVPKRTAERAQALSFRQGSRRSAPWPRVQPGETRRASE